MFYFLFVVCERKHSDKRGSYRKKLIGFLYFISLGKLLGFVCDLSHKFLLSKNDTWNAYQCRRIFLGPFPLIIFVWFHWLFVTLYSVERKILIAMSIKMLIKYSFRLQKQVKVRTESLFPVEKFIIITSSTLEDIWKMYLHAGWWERNVVTEIYFVIKATRWFLKGKINLNIHLHLN